MKRRRIRGVNVDEPVGWPGVDDLSDHGIAGARDVPAAERHDGHISVPLGANAEPGGEDLAPLAERPRTRFQSAFIKELARDHYLAPSGIAPVLVLLITLLLPRQKGGPF